MKRLSKTLAAWLLLVPSLAMASATCELANGRWRCGGSTLKEAQDACTVTVPGGQQTCDSSINVCTCSASTIGKPVSVKTK